MERKSKGPPLALCSQTCHAKPRTQRQGSEDWPMLAILDARLAATERKHKTTALKCLKSQHTRKRVTIRWSRAALKKLKS